MRLKIQNLIKYQFSNPVSYGIQRLRLIPRKASNQKIINWNINYVGAKEQTNYKDHHENHCTLITFLPEVTEIIIRVTGIVKTQKVRKFSSKNSEVCPHWIYKNETTFTTAGESILDFCHLWSKSPLPKIKICWQSKKV